MDTNYSLAIKQSNTDEWYTPAGGVELIVPYLKERGYKKILCPFDTAESEFVRVLREKGFNVAYSHIATGTDFFSINDLSDYDAVVSNPPFSKREAILERLFVSGIPFALIMNFNGLFDSRGRWKLFRKYRFEILVPLGRLRFFSADGIKNSPNFQSVYVCSGMLDKQIEFAECDIDEITGRGQYPYDAIEYEQLKLL